MINWQLHHDNVPTHTNCLVQRGFLHNIKPAPPYSPHLVLGNFWHFPKLKSALNGKRFQTTNEIQENMLGHLMAIGRTVWGPKVLTLKGTEASLSYVQCFLYLVSSSINVSIFHIHGWGPSGKTSYINKKMITWQAYTSTVMLTDPERDYNSITMKWLEEWFFDWLILCKIQLHRNPPQQNPFKYF